MWYYIALFYALCFLIVVWEMMHAADGDGQPWAD